ncbi:hypothetical protein ACFPTO_13545 [Paraburkholderia denitrificans]|uniref:Cysteine dioxygenase n=1 Tax=Paraburkholderia denitrificans TaxID=694025 RepID=A0ABW0J9U2_9BURK
MRILKIISARHQYTYLQVAAVLNKNSSDPEGPTTFLDSVGPSPFHLCVDTGFEGADAATGADPAGGIGTAIDIRRSRGSTSKEMLRARSRHTRNLIHEAPDKSLSLYALVWLPGQWTPVHGHGSWGVVGVIEGTLEERS